MLSNDYLPGTKMPVWQDPDMFRINTDTQLLGMFLRIRRGSRVLDIGTNNGALLLYASRFSPAELVGIDPQQKAVLLARRNLRRNHLEGRILTGEVQTLQDGPFDAVLCNPPYLKSAGGSLEKQSKSLQIARMERYLPLPELFPAVKRLLKDNGRFFLIHRACRLGELMQQAEAAHLAVRRMQFAYDNPDAPAGAVLLELTPGPQKDIRIEKPVLLRREAGA